MDKFSVALATTAGERPYHAKRPHRKSRTGCGNCKKRKVKCDEGRPACRICTTRKETCVYPVVGKRTTPSPETPGRLKQSSPGPGPVAAYMGPVPRQPFFVASGRDEVDMRLLWFYTTATYASFSSGPLKERSVDAVLKVNVVHHAFAHPFLMNCLLGLAAMHVNHLGIRNIGVTRAHEIMYRTKAFEQYRKAVEAADPATYPALLATSLFLCGLSTHMFRGEDARPLAVLDWIVLWVGIGAIIKVTQLPTLFSSGISALFYRPDIDFNASARHVPSHLLFMIASIKPGDDDYPLVQNYYTALQLLGSLYRELVEGGIGPKLLLRVVTFPTFLPKEVIDAARARRPRALVILAHYLVWTKFRILTCWWIEGISDYEIPHIYRFVGPEWHHTLRIPMATLPLAGDRELARLLLEDPTWEPPAPVADEEPLAPDNERELAIRAAKGEDVGAEVQEYRQRQVKMSMCV